MKNNLILWDLDKTLLTVKNLDTFEITYVESFSELERAAKLEKPGKTDKQIIMEMLPGASSNEVDKFLHTLDAVTQRESKNMGIAQVPGAAEAICTAYSLGWTQGVYTGNTPTRGREKLLRAGLLSLSSLEADLQRTGFFLGHESKRLDGVKRVKKAFPPEETTYLVLGDTPNDYAVAEALDAFFWYVNDNKPAPDWKRVIGSAVNFKGDNLESFKSALQEIHCV